MVAGSRYRPARVRILLDLAARHDGDPVRDRERLVLVVGHEHGRDADALLDLPDVLAHAHAQLRVEVRERLVEEQQLRLEHERSGERDALLLAAGDARRDSCGRDACRPTSSSTCSPRAHPIFRPRQFAQPQPERDVLEHGHVRPERVVLEDHRRRPLVRRQRGRHRCRLIRMRPRSGMRKPPIMRRVVVLPQPDGPRRHVSSPARTSSCISSTIVRPPRSLETFWICRPSSCQRSWNPSASLPPITCFRANAIRTTDGSASRSENTAATCSG